MSTEYPHMNPRRTSVYTRSVRHLLLLLLRRLLTKDIWGPLSRFCLFAEPSLRRNWLISAHSLTPQAQIQPAAEAETRGLVSAQQLAISIRGHVKRRTTVGEVEPTVGTGQINYTSWMFPFAQLTAEPFLGRSGPTRGLLGWGWRELGGTKGLQGPTA